jgi:AcrR family transcriptional regulator
MFYLMPTKLPPARYLSAAPSQERSKETMARFAQAAEQLLQDRPFEEISVQDIVQKAERPIGSFYARFKSKDALLPFLYQRYDAGLEDVFKTRLARHDWTALGFPETLEAIVDFVLGLYDDRRWLIRALALFTRLRPDSLPRDVVPSRRRLYEGVVAIVLRHEAKIRHEDKAAAVRFGLFLVESTAREKLLFAQAPHARVTPIGRKALRAELVRALHGYLTCEVPR